LDPKEHVDKDLDKAKEKRKRMARGNPTTDKNRELTVEDSLGTYHDDEASEDNQMGVAAVSPIHLLEAVTVDDTVENDLVVVAESNPISMSNATEEFTPGLDTQKNTVEFTMTSSSTDLDESFEREDGIGRRILPIRPVRAPALVTSSESSTPSESLSIPPLEHSPSVGPNDYFMEDSLIEDDLETDDGLGRDDGLSPIVSLLSGQRRPRNEGGSGWSRGRGKGGLNLRILRGRITKEVSKAEETKNKKVAWKQWVKGYTAEINEIIKNNPKGLHIVCEDCKKNVAKQSYLRHRTVNGCSKMNQRIRFFNWN
jgi:hypothetical protein